MGSSEDLLIGGLDQTLSKQCFDLSVECQNSVDVVALYVRDAGEYVHPDVAERTGVAHNLIGEILPAVDTRANEIAGEIRVQILLGGKSLHDRLQYGFVGLRPKVAEKMGRKMLGDHEVDELLQLVGGGLLKVLLAKPPNFIIRNRAVPDFIQVAAKRGEVDEGFESLDTEDGRCGDVVPQQPHHAGRVDREVGLYEAGFTDEIEQVRPGERGLAIEAFPGKKAVQPLVLE